MEKKFRVLRIVGTIWKVLAWIALIVGFLASVGMLLMSIFGGEMMNRFMPLEQMPWAPRLFGVAGGIVSFLISLVVTLIYFLLFYAIGELIYLLLAIEENTRLTPQFVQARPAPQSPLAPRAFPPPPPPSPTPFPPPPPSPPLTPPPPPPDPQP